MNLYRKKDYKMSTSIISAGFTWCEVSSVRVSTMNEEEKKILKQVLPSLIAEHTVH